MDQPLITVSGQGGTNISFDVTSVGFDTEKKYTVAEFNQALKKADEKWLKEIWDGISYPNDIVIVTIENLHNDPCTYRFNFSDAEFHSIQEIVSLSPTPMHASISTEDAIEVLNRAETDALSKAPDQENFIISQTANNTFVVKSDSEMFGKGVTVFESNNRDECVDYVSQRQPPRDWQVYVIKDLLSWSNPELVPERSKIEYFDTVEDAVARFNEYRNSPYSSETAIEKTSARLTLGMSSEPYAVDILHVRDNQNYLVEDFDYMQEMNTDRNFLDTLAKITADVGFERIIIGKVRDISFEDWDNPYFREGSQVDFIIQSRHVEKAVKSHIEKAFPVQTPSQEQGVSHITKNADPSATRGESRGNTMEQNRQALYSIEREGEMYFFKAPKECSIEDIMKNASFDTLMKLGEQIDKATFSAIDQSEQLTFSVEMNFDTDRALICKVNDGRGGLTLADRNDLDFPGEDVYEVQISREREILREKEYSQSLSETKAAPSAIRAERQDTMSNTKMECTGMVTLAEGNAKAVAQVTINNEFAIKGIKVYEGEKGLFVSMPSRKIGSEYQDIVFPITAEARAQLNSAVLETYGKLVESGLEKLPIEKNASPEKSTSKISVSLHMLNDEKTKAVGQIVIDDSIVVSGVKVRHGTNAQGEEKDFVSMPSYQTQTGEYKEYALPVTKDCYEKVNKAVLGSYETLQKTEYKGVNLSELGTKGEVSSKYGINNVFAAKLMAELDKQNIPYSAKVAPDATTLSVKNADRAAVDKVQKALTEALTAEKKAAQNQQPEQQTQSKPKKAR